MLRFALRSILRRPGRTTGTAAVVAVCVTALATRHSITEAIERFTHEAVVETRTGAVVVRPPGGFDEVPLGAPPTLSPDIVAAVTKQAPAAAARLYVTALLSDAKTETPVVVRGVDPALEPVVCPRFSRELRAGGAWLSGDAQGVVGFALADALGLSVGQTVTLSSTGTTRANALELKVVSISESGLALENRRVITVPLRLAQQLAGIEGVSELGIATGDDPAKLRDALAAQLGASAEVRTWQDVHPLARDTVERQHRLDLFATLVLLSVVLTALLALGLLAVDERVREVGTLMSFGMRRSQIAAMFFFEGVLLGALGAAAGLALTAAVTGWLGARGIQVPHMGAAHPAVLRPALSLVTVAWGSALALVASACTGALVAWRVTRLRPIEAARR